MAAAKPKSNYPMDATEPNMVQWGAHGGKFVSDAHIGRCRHPHFANLACVRRGSAKSHGYKQERFLWRVPHHRTSRDPGAATNWTTKDSFTKMSETYKSPTSGPLYKHVCEILWSKRAPTGRCADSDRCRTVANALGSLSLKFVDLGLSSTISIPPPDQDWELLVACRKLPEGFPATTPNPTTKKDAGRHHRGRSVK